MCKDIPGLISKIRTERNISSDTPDENLLLKIGLDGSGGFLKVCLSLVLLDDNEQSSMKRRRSFCESPCTYFKDSGVKRLLLLAVAPSVQENYENLLKLWINLGLHTFEEELYIASDLKLTNILLGLMAHGATHPCAWCDSRKGSLHLDGNPRTFETLKTSFWEYMDDGRKKESETILQCGTSFDC